VPLHQNEGRPDEANEERTPRLVIGGSPLSIG
jgi:hypothetical protein